MAERLRRVWRRRRSSAQAPDLDWSRVETLEARMAHLEAELEGLQDAVYQRARVDDEQIDDLRRRTAPEQLARDLSEDARKRGL
jgi:uncharacterized coiled-coil protein SlyX